MYFVAAKQNMIVTDTLKEVYQFLKLIQERGLAYAVIVGTDQAVRLTENGHWVWTKPNDTPRLLNAPQRTYAPTCPDCTAADG